MSTTPYVAHLADAHGHITYSDDEHAVWATLYARQRRLLHERACTAYLDGLERLRLPGDHIPQLAEINRVLHAATGWQVAAVPALIPFQTFFALLANRQFPAATFIRRREELDYLQEPDLFHELFGHCPLLTDPWFAVFTQCYGQLGLRASAAQRPWLARLYWMTVEFGLVDTPAGVRIYGGGILSSPKETLHALSEVPQREPFDTLTVMRTPYRIDILQPLYFVLPNLQRLAQLANENLLAQVAEASRLGLRAPLFSAKPEPAHD